MPTGSYFRVFALEATLGIPLPGYPYDSGHSLASIVWFKYLLHQLNSLTITFHIILLLHIFIYLLSLQPEATGKGSYGSIKTGIRKFEKLGTRSN